MSSVIKKIGTVRLDKGVDVSSVIHFGAPAYVRIAEAGSNKNFNAYELYVEETTKPTKKTKEVIDKAD